VDFPAICLAKCLSQRVLLSNPRRIFFSLALRALSFAIKYISLSRTVQVSVSIGAAHCSSCIRSTVPPIFFVGTHFEHPYLTPGQGLGCFDTSISAGDQPPSSYNWVRKPLEECYAEKRGCKKAVVRSAVRPMATRFGGAIGS
jgi:hypothetical protein